MGGDSSWLPIIHPEDRETTQTAWLHSVRTGEPLNLEVRFHDRKRNTYVWMLSTARAARNDQGEIIKWYGSTTDIDRQKKAEQQVVDILEGMNDSFFAIDADWNLSRINSKMEATTQIRREDTVGKNFFLSFPMEKDSKYWINHHKIMEDRVRVQYEEYYAPLDLWTEARGYPTADGGLAYLFRDITVEKKALEKLEVLTRELQEAIRIRDEFLSIASHELRTPVTSLKLQMQVVQKWIDGDAAGSGPISTEKIQKKVHTANAQIQRLERLIDTLLDVSRIDAGNMSYQFEDLELSTLVLDCIEQQSETFARQNRKMITDVEDNIRIQGDALRIEQVLTNLLSNALKYGGSENVRVGLKRSENSVHLTVQDHGMGIPVENQAQIFQRFERLVPHTSISGMGLGLYIAQQIVEAHHGTITVVSAPGLGSTFDVRLPLLHL